VTRGRSFVSRGPRTGFDRCPVSWSLISSRGPPSSSGEDTSSDFPGWTSSPSRRRSTGRAIKEAVRNQTCRSPPRRRVPPRRAVLRFHPAGEGVAGRAAVAPPASRGDLHGRPGGPGRHHREALIVLLGSPSSAGPMRPRSTTEGGPACRRLSSSAMIPCPRPHG